MLDGAGVEEMLNRTTVRMPALVGAAGGGVDVASSILGDPGGFQRVRFRVLGVVGLDSDDGIAIEARGNGRSLLAALALTPNRPVPGDLLIDAVWGESGAARSTLHVEMSRLRTWMRVHGDGLDRIETSADGYVLRVDPEELDSTRMLEQIKRGEEAFERDDPLTASGLLADAVAFWGEPFGGLGYVPPFDAIATELREARARAEELLTESQLVLGSPDVGRLRRLVEEEPTRELRWQHLMLALYRSGRQTEALKVYRNATEQLAEIGLLPSQPLIDLEDAILARDPGLDPLSRMALPAENSTFVGRRQTVDDLTALVQRHRLVSITGPGGVGKSRLALRVAHRLADSFRDGAAFVPLAHVAEPGMVPSAVASAIGAVQRSGISVAEAVKTVVRDRSLLIVLDNCEHVALAAADIARELVAASESTSVITTSQHDLRIPGAVMEHVAPLDIPDSALSSDLVGSDAVRLFRERAAERTRLDLEPRTVVIAEICRRLDGIPLAIELAATLCDARSVTEILAALDKGDEVVVQSTSDGIAHHRSWHRAITWSLGLLAEDEREALQRLAVFRGGFDRRAALDVCSGGVLSSSDLDALIDRLLSKSVLIASHRASGVRFSMLESIRQASLQGLERAEGRRLSIAHRDYFMGRALENGPLIYVGTAQAVDALEADLDNIRAAFRLAIEGRQGDPAIDPAPEVAGAFVLVLMPFWTTQGHVEEAADSVRRVLEATDHPDDPRLRLAAGTAAAFNADYDSAFEHFEFAEIAFEAMDRKSLLAWSRFQDARARTVGVIAGRVDRAVLDVGAALFEAARERFVAKGEHVGAALAGMFGGVNAVLRSSPDADEVLDSALAEARSAGAVDVEAMAWAMCALLDLRDGRAAEARARFEESASSLRRDRNWLNAQICTTLAAYAACVAGDHAASVRLAAEGARLQIAFGNSEWHALTLATTALVASHHEEDLARRLVRTLDRHLPLWKQLARAPFDQFSALEQVDPGGPSVTLDPLDALRHAADRLEPAE